LYIRDCQFLDGNGTTPSTAYIVITAPCTEFVIQGCTFGQLPTSTYYIQTAGANYGLICDCYFNEAAVDTDAEITLGTGVRVAGCWDHRGIAIVT
jgi:hypothetical protein